MRLEVVSSFHARFPELLADPLREMPINLRRMLAGLNQLDEPFASAAVQERLGVSDRTAREWLKRWREELLANSGNGRPR